LVFEVGLLRPAVSCCVVRKEGNAGITVVSTDTLLDTLGTLEAPLLGTETLVGRLEAGEAFVEAGEAFVEAGEALEALEALETVEAEAVEAEAVEAEAVEAEAVEAVSLFLRTLSRL